MRSLAGRAKVNRKNVRSVGCNKNKLYYKFYPEFSKYIECTYEEIRNLSRRVQGVEA